MSEPIYAVRTGGVEHVFSEQLAYEESSFEEIQSAVECRSSRSRTTRARGRAACIATLTAALMASAPALAQNTNLSSAAGDVDNTLAPRGGYVVIPESSIAHPG